MLIREEYRALASLMPLLQSGTPAKSVASARVSSSVPKENVPANTGAGARAAGALRPKAVAGDSTVADLTEQVHATPCLRPATVNHACMLAIPSTPLQLHPVCHSVFGSACDWSDFRFSQKRKSQSCQSHCWLPV